MPLTREFSIYNPYPNPKAVLVMVPPCQCDGRGDIEFGDWRRFADKHHLAMVGCFFQDEHPGWIEDYCNMKYGAGDALIAFLGKHFNPIPPLLMWGFSAGGQFNFEFANAHPEMVAGFVVNKGGVYHTCLASPEARKVPAMFFVGLADETFRVNILRGIYALNKRAGAQWDIMQENVAHSIGISELVSIRFFKEILRKL